ncbi:type II secretion system F family protein [Pelosinus fermentans]|uniref:Type II secretion system F domain-containing protein n=1 Tax=Pelosinus fermentans JBW45 TaxID=1192197 RepID=I9DC93_9FIRM|nr:type II secretion system F family protein [Pelosinus fermentans]AJQ26831.1 Type II secretion system F domain-containing protein [Pelosinus fermentans JBW45]
MLIVALLSGMLVFIIFLVLIEYYGRGKTHITRKVLRYTGDARDMNDAEKKNDHVEKFMKFIRYLGLKVRGAPQAKGLEVKMQQAGFPLLGSEFLALVGVAVLAVGILGMMLTMQVLYAITFGIVAGLGCFLYLNIRITNRQKEFSNQLGDVLIMMSNAMRSGFSFMQAMDLIAKEMKPPVSVEFFKTIAEIRLGADTETALLNMGKRVQSSDLDLAVTAVLIQRQVGGNLAQILDTIAGTINERIKMKREIKTLTVQGRISGWVLAALPFGIAVFASIINPGYMRPFIEEPIGRIMLAGAVISELVGFLIIRRIVNIDV